MKGGLCVKFLVVAVSTLLPTGIKSDGEWSKGHATFYEGGTGTFGMNE